MPAPAPELRSSRGQARQRVGWDTALDTAARTLCGDHRRTRPRREWPYGAGQLPHRGLPRFNKLVKGLIGTNNPRHQPRLCMSRRGGGLQAQPGRRRAAPQLRRHRPHPAPLASPAANTAFAHPIAFRRIEDARRPGPDLEAGWSSTPTTGHRRGADSCTCCPAGHHHALQRHAPRDAVGEAGSTTLHRGSTGGLRRPQEDRPRIPRRWPRSICGLDRTGHRGGRADLAANSPAGCRCTARAQPVQLGNRQQLGADQPAPWPRPRSDRPGPAGPFAQPHRPAAPWAARSGGLANLLSAHRDMATRITAPRSAALCGRPRHPATPGGQRRSNCSGPKS